VNTDVSEARHDAERGRMPSTRDLADAIVRSCSDYMQQRTRWSPRLNDELRGRALRIRTVLVAALGLLQWPLLARDEAVHVFHTVRHADYMALFDPASVLVTGGVEEWRLARRRGYRFVWAFGPIDSVDLALFRGWMLPLRLALAQWRWAFGRARRVTVFLFEDTLQHGAFLAHLVGGLANEARSVCIAHGYYGELDVPLRYEGELCDHNFVWDERQVALLSATHSNLAVIGLPYDARALPTPLRTVVLVGVGHPDAEPAVHERSMRCFTGIAAIASQRHGCEVLYRPHPAERADPRLMSALRERFGALDELRLEDRLNGPRAVFVGFVSSLLHEAAVAGHRVVYLPGHPGTRPLFHRDLELSPEDIEPFDGWLERVRDESPESPAGLPRPPDAQERFRRAVAALR